MADRPIARLKTSTGQHRNSAKRSTVAGHRARPGAGQAGAGRAVANRAGALFEPRILASGCERRTQSLRNVERAPSVLPLVKRDDELTFLEKSLRVQIYKRQRTARWVHARRCARYAGAVCLVCKCALIAKRDAEISAASNGGERGTIRRTAAARRSQELDCIARGRARGSLVRVAHDLKKFRLSIAPAVRCRPVLGLELGTLPGIQRARHQDTGYSTVDAGRRYAIRTVLKVSASAPSARRERGLKVRSTSTRPHTASSCMAGFHAGAPTARHRHSCGHYHRFGGGAHRLSDNVGR